LQLAPRPPKGGAKFAVASGQFTVKH
jgi:hypothetical protein